MRFAQQATRDGRPGQRWDAEDTTTITSSTNPNTISTIVTVITTSTARTTTKQKHINQVLELRMKKPRGWLAAPGDYLFLKVPPQANPDLTPSCQPDFPIHLASCALL